MAILLHDPIPLLNLCLNPDIYKFEILFLHPVNESNYHTSFIYFNQLTIFFYLYHCLSPDGHAEQRICSGSMSKQKHVFHFLLKQLVIF